jgi:hypothetical protein
MTDTSHSVAPGIDRAFDTMTPASMMLVALRMWQWPMMAGSVWWRVMADGCWPRSPSPTLPPHHPADGQLVVPQPIEADGERGLVA